MTTSVRILAGLPPYGPAATPIPADWGRRGGEGLVVEFDTDGETWVANVQRGLGGLDLAAPHPSGRGAVVIASGDLYEVDPVARVARLLLPAIDAALPVESPEGWILSRQGIALVRYGPAGLTWHTRRLSWDGFDDLRIEGGLVVGGAWSPLDSAWLPFRVDLETGRAEGGSFSDQDEEGWEHLSGE